MDKFENADELNYCGKRIRNVMRKLRTPEKTRLLITKNDVLKYPLGTSLQNLLLLTFYRESLSYLSGFMLKAFLEGIPSGLVWAMPHSFPPFRNALPSTAFL